MAGVTDAEFEAAVARGDRMMAGEPRASGLRLIRPGAES